MSRIEKHYRIKQDLADYIEAIKEKNDCRSNSHAVELILKEHRENLNFSLEEKTNLIADVVAKRTIKSMHKILKYEKKNDRNIQILIEMLNGLFINENQMDIMNTNERMHEAYQTARYTVDTRLEKESEKQFNKY